MQNEFFQMLKKDHVAVKGILGQLASTKDGAGAAQNTAQKAAQYRPETVRNGSKPSDRAKTETSVSSRIYEGFRNTGYSDNKYSIVPRGFEPLYNH
jgi:hypothetical protein